MLTTPRGGPLKWVDAPEDAYGPLVLHLVNSEGFVVGIVQSDTIVKQIDSARLLVSYETRVLDDWHRDPTNSNALDISILRIDDLHPIEDPLAQYKNMETQKRQFVIAGVLEAHCAIPLKVPEGIHSYGYPDDFKSIDELLHVSEYLPLQRLPDQLEDDALFVLRPKKDEYEVFPQDWYNLEGWDSMYMFPYKAVRDPTSGRIFVRGIRIGDRVLDESNRTVEKR